MFGIAITKSFKVYQLRTHIPNKHVVNYFSSTQRKLTINSYEILGVPVNAS